MPRGLGPCAAWMVAFGLALGVAAPGRATAADDATPPGTAVDVPAVDAPAIDAPRTQDLGPSRTATRWTIDDARSQAQFRIRLLGIVPMSGEFLRPRGTIAFDADGGDARVDARLSSADIRMANPAHADWARSAEFFDAERHPEIQFRSRPVPQRVLREGGPIDGELSLRGVTREVGLKVERGGCDPARVRECEIEVYGQVRRSDFGMAARRATVGDWVSLRLRIVAVATDVEPP